MICAGCLVDFPAGLVQPLVTDDTNESLCGVCALERTRQIHGDPTLEFHGPRAREIYRRSKLYKEQLAKRAKGGR